jgi:hypothetical protein
MKMKSTHGRRLAGPASVGLNGLLFLRYIPAALREVIQLFKKAEVTAGVKVGVWTRDVIALTPSKA